MLKTLSALSVFLVLGACSSGGSNTNNTPDTPNNPVVPTIDTGTSGTAAVGSPSNTELLASEGAVSREQAELLVQGSWVYTVPSSQCVITLSFGEIQGFSGMFSETSLDKAGSGEYFFDDDSGLEIVFDYNQDNIQADCYGDIENTLEEGVTYSNFIRFNDQNSMALSSNAAGTAFVRVFSRQ